MLSRLLPGGNAIALLFSAYVVIIMLMPAKYLFTLTGVGLCVAGCIFIKTQTGLSVLGIVAGIVLIVLGIRTAVREHRKEIDDAEQAVQEANRARKSRK